MQLFRSVDERSVEFQRVEDGSAKGLEERGLTSVRGRLVERGVLAAMVEKIRAAERFVYVENQFFVGSS